MASSPNDLFPPVLVHPPPDPELPLRIRRVVAAATRRAAAAQLRGLGPPPSDLAAYAQYAVEVSRVADGAGKLLVVHRGLLPKSAGPLREFVAWHAATPSGPLPSVQAVDARGDGCNVMLGVGRALGRLPWAPPGERSEADRLAFACELVAGLIASGDDRPATRPRSDDVESRVLDYILNHKDELGRLTRDSIAAALGVSTGTVSKTAAWKSLARHRHTHGKGGPRTVRLSDELLAVLPNELADDPAEAAAVRDELQQALDALRAPDLEADPRRQSEIAALFREQLAEARREARQTRKYRQAQSARRRRCDRRTDDDED